MREEFLKLVQGAGHSLLDLRRKFHKLSPRPLSLVTSILPTVGDGVAGVAFGTIPDPLRHVAREWNGGQRGYCPRLVPGARPGPQMHGHKLLGNLILTSEWKKREQCS